MIKEYFNIIILIWIGIALLLFPVLLKISAPYGRHTRKGWGAVLPNRLGWVIMETPSLIVFLIFSLTGQNSPSGLTWLFIVIWTVHYTNRAFIYPMRTHTKGKMMPLIIIAFAICFNLVNGFMNGFYFGTIRPGFQINLALDIRFITGVILFFVGAFINVQSDNILLSLRKKTTNGYVIPEGGVFKYVSCPNFFGEILEWGGFALMTWSPAALAFVIWTIVNLLPRGIDHHKWYKEKFPDYPAKRKAIIPFLL